MHPVNITGIGVICPGADTYEDLKTLLYSGETSIRIHSDSNFQQLSSNIGGGLADYDIQAKYQNIEKRIGTGKRASHALRTLRKTLRRGPWSFKISLLGMMDAIIDSHFFEDSVPGHRQAVIAAGTLNTGHYLYKSALHFRSENGDEDPFYVPMCFDSILASAAAEILDISGPCFLCSSVCSSGNQALLNAQMLINSGTSDRVLVIGAVHDFSPVEYESLVKMRAIPAGVYTQDSAKLLSMPFDAERKGFIPTHGTGTVILERLGLSDRNQIRASLIGVGSSNDRNSGLSAHSAGQLIALRQLFDNIDLSPDQIDFVSAHATGTERGDSTELETLQQFFNVEAKTKVPKITAPKSILGHCLSSSAIVEMITGIACLSEARLHGHPSLTSLMETNGTEIVKDAVPIQASYFLNNSFGFGGLNSCTVVGIRHE